MNFLGLAGAGQDPADRLDDGNPLERTALALPPEETACVGGERGIKLSHLGNAFANEVELIGLAICERAEQHGVDDGKHRGGSADAEGQSENGDGCEGGRFAQGAQAVAQIL